LGFRVSGFGFKTKEDINDINDDTAHYYHEDINDINDDTAHYYHYYTPGCGFTDSLEGLATVWI